MVLGRKTSKHGGCLSSTTGRSSIPEDSPPSSLNSAYDSRDSSHSPFYLTSGSNPGIHLISKVFDDQTMIIGALP